MRLQVDHAWTFSASDALAQLEAVPGLLPRVAAMAGVRVPGGGDDQDGVAGADSATDEEEEEEERELRPRPWLGGREAEALQSRVLSAAQRLLGCYRLPGEDGGAEPTWFLCDEVGSALRHSDAPSCACVPFLYSPPGGGPPAAYSLLWTLRPLAESDELTRDYCASSECSREGVLACLFRGREQDAADAWHAHQQAQEAVAAAAAAAPPPDVVAPPDESWACERRPLRVFTDIDWVADELRRPDFVHVATAAEADVMWTKAPLDARSAAAAGASAECMLNQFPGEEALGTFSQLLFVARWLISSPAAQCSSICCPAPRPAPPARPDATAGCPSRSTVSASCLLWRARTTPSPPPPPRRRFGL